MVTSHRLISELSYALIKLNRIDEALASLRQITERDGSRYPIAYYHLARLYEQKGQLTNAEELFVKANSADTASNYAMLLDISRVRQHQGDFKGALSALEGYVTAMESLGLKPIWSDESLSLLRRKASGQSQ